MRTQRAHPVFADCCMTSLRVRHTCRDQSCRAMLGLSNTDHVLALGHAEGRSNARRRRDNGSGAVLAKTAGAARNNHTCVCTFSAKT
jgi:hypothetical protein